MIKFFTKIWDYLVEIGEYKAKNFNKFNSMY